MKNYFMIILYLCIILTSTACSNAVAFHYREMARADRFVSGGQVKGIYPDLFVVYDICGIQNIASNAEDFIFALQKLGAEIISNKVLGPKDLDAGFAFEAFNPVNTPNLLVKHRHHDQYLNRS